MDEVCADNCVKHREDDRRNRTNVLRYIFIDVELSEGTSGKTAGHKEDGRRSLNYELCAMSIDLNSDS